MKAPADLVPAVAVLLLATGSAHVEPKAPTCSAQVQTNPSFERGPAGWTAGPRTVVVADPVRPAHTGRAYAALAGLDLTRREVLHSTVTIPAGCGLTVRFHARATTTETTRGDYLNVGLAVTGEPPKTRFSFAYDLPQDWHEFGAATAAAATERTATITFAASETAGGGVTAFDVDDVTATLQPPASQLPASQLPASNM